jgi:LysM repeat protein
MKKNTFAALALALLLVALIAGCKRAKPTVVSEVQAIPTATATAPAGRTVVSPTSPTSTSEAETTPEITPTPSPEAATPTLSIEVTNTATMAPTSTPVPTITPTAAPTTAPAATPTAAPSGERTHVVQPGENLFRISLHYGMSYQAVAAANGIINPDLIYAGQQLTIPAEVPAEPTEGGIYVVQPGDNLFRIALMHGVTVEAIAVANDISNVNLIHPGQELRIP